MLNNTEIDLKITIRKEFETVHDLSYILLDLQSYLTGFMYINDIAKRAENELQFVANEFDETSFLTDEILRRIQEIIYIEEPNKKRIRNELNYLIQPVAERKSKSIRSYPITRRITTKYKDTLKLKRFEQGSLILEIASSVLSGLLIDFIKKLLFSGEQQGISNTFNYTIQGSNQIIVLNTGEKHLVNPNQQRIKITEGQILKRISVPEYINEVNSKVKYNQHDIESTVKSFLEVLKNDGLISEYITYDNRAIKTFVNSIERIRGNFLDIRM